MKSRKEIFVYLLYLKYLKPNFVEFISFDLAVAHFAVLRH